MGKESFRFVHASDFHLERPLHDLLDVPDHLRVPLLDAPWKAAQAVFEHALLEEVDFVLLCGDLLNPVSTGANGPSFLLDHFEELAAKDIHVFWAGGSVDDPDRWPEAITLPEQVHLFSKRQVEPVIYRRNGHPLVTILGRSNDGRESIRAAEYSHEPDDTFVIGIGHGAADAESLMAERIDYWALGGDHQRNSVQNDAPPIRYSGSPQGRSIQEVGPHGFYSVEIDGQRHIQIHPIDSDVFRYSVQTVDAEDMALGRDLRQLLAKRINKLQSESAGRHTLVRWLVHLDLEQASVVGPAALEDLLLWLRREFGHGQPAAWSTEIEIIPPKNLPKKWQEEDTILGDFLRTSTGHRKTGGKDLSIKPIVDAETPATSLWQSALSTSDASAQAALLERATLLGVDLLRGQQVDLLANTRRFGGTDTRS
jgi:DNA repair exonuclease SbcCD nuclease subunit